MMKGATMARQLLRDLSETTRAIMDGEHDDELDHLMQAIRARIKDRFRPGTRVRIVGDQTLAGEVGVVIKVNQTRVAVGLGEPQSYGGYKREFNVPSELLELA